MNQVSRLITLSLLFLSLLIASPVRAGLAGDIDDVVSDKLLARAQVGIDIVRLGKNAADVAAIYQSHSTDPLIPASNLKVITTSAALQKLGPDFKFRTQLILHDGNLILLGDGDPTFGDAELLKKAGWSVDTVFKAWAADLAKRGVTTINDLLVDDSVFDDEFLNPNWPADQTQKRYMAEVAGLNLNANCLDLYVRPGNFGQIVNYSVDPDTSYAAIKNTCVAGDDNAVWFSRDPGSNDLILRGKARNANDVPISVTVHDPPMFAGTFLADVLKANGISMKGTVKRDRTQRAAFAQGVAKFDLKWTLVAVHETPLLSVISRANKDSMNLYAECVCKRLGFATAGNGTWKDGTAAVSDFLTSLRIPQSQFTLDDGCGLSKLNAISSNVMVTVLTHDFFSANSDQWLGCLAVAGEDGTLLDRFKGSDLRGRVIAKTGFVNGVSCLSGYLHARDDTWYCFSIMFNGIPEGTNSTAKTLQERIVMALDKEMKTQAQAAAN